MALTTRMLVSAGSLITALLGSLLVATPAHAEPIYTAAEVHLHNKRSDCWTIVSGGVYNLTSFVTRHEGGTAAIIGMCGVDATIGFLAQHRGESEPTRTLAGFRIGALDPNTPPTPTTVYSIGDLRMHAVAADCWTAVSGGVYDLTGWIAVHPGGSAVIVGMCGIDGTSSFMSQHTGDANPIAILEQFKIGIFDPTPPPAGTEYTMAQVATHNTAADCWSAIKNNVYDLTTWVNAHPGGAALITAMCGKDGTTAFVGYHGSATNPNSVLGQFKIGILTGSTTPGDTKYTMAQVAMHNTAADCWSVVKNVVYNLSAWVNAHPGGAAVITAMCGKDGTDAFVAAHGSATNPNNILGGFKIGILATGLPQYTLAQVKLHNTAANCWTIVGTNVYDVTAWIPLHPGGQAQIKAMCGLNATAAFNGQHSGSAKAKASLAPYKIGTFKSTTVTTKYYTMTQVRAHKTRTNCWTAILGKVYNLTKWIAQHPGGSEAIIELCGTNGTSGFLEGHSGDAAAAGQLAAFKIGVLKTTKPVVTTKKYTLAQVRTHSTASNCWSIVGSNVYNLTKWIPLHPGGQAQIKAMCGVDASAGFNGQHSGNANAKASLAKYKIGTYSKSSTPAVVLKNYTAKQVATHKSSSDCWSIVNKKVYNLTKWIPLHPGGQAQIKAMCGLDASAGFNGQHSGNAKALSSLARYRIGTLVGSTPTPAPVGTTYSLTQIKSHKTATNCWTANAGVVYSLGAWLRKQKASDFPAAKICGVDSTAFFKKKFGSSASAATALKLYKIGKLK